MEEALEVEVKTDLQFSPQDSLPCQNGLDEGCNIKEVPLSQLESSSDGRKCKGTKRKASIDLQLYTCEVCQVKLNSASQAYQHFQGKSHQGKVKMLEMAAEVKAPPVNINHPAPPLSSSTPAQNTADVLPSTIEHYCAICQKVFNSKNQAEQHFSGKAHRHKLSENAIANLHGTSRSPLGKKNDKPNNSNTTDLVKISGTGYSSTNELFRIGGNSSTNDLVKIGSNSSTADLVKIGSNSSTADLVKIGGNVKSALFSCEYCHITLNSERQYDQHVKGLRHKIIVGKAKPPPPPQGEEPGWQEIRYKKLATAITTVGLLSNCSSSASISPGGTRLGQYYCKDCDVSVNSPVQLQQHMSSAKHKAKLDGTVIVKKKTARGRGGSLVTGRGTGRGRGIPSLSSNFVKGERRSYHSTQTTVNMLSTNAMSMNNTVLNNQKNGYMDYLHSPWGVHMPTYPTQMF